MDASFIPCLIIALISSFLLYNVFYKYFRDWKKNKAENPVKYERMMLYLVFCAIVCLSFGIPVISSTVSYIEDFYTPKEILDGKKNRDKELSEIKEFEENVGELDKGECEELLLRYTTFLKKSKDFDAMRLQKYRLKIDNTDFNNSIEEKIKKYEERKSQFLNDEYEERRERRKSNERNNSEDSYSGSKCLNCGMGYYQSDGICSRCGAASPSRTNSSYEKSNMYQKCEGCNGTGYQGSEICPVCKGRGEYRAF